MGSSRYYEYHVNNNGKDEYHGADYGQDYFTDVVANRSAAFIQVRAKAGNAASFKALCSTQSSNVAMSSADHVQRSAPNSPEQPTLNDAHFVADCSASSARPRPMRRRPS